MSVCSTQDSKPDGKRAGTLTQVKKKWTASGERQIITPPCGELFRCWCSSAGHRVRIPRPPPTSPVQRTKECAIPSHSLAGLLVRNPYGVGAPVLVVVEAVHPIQKGGWSSRATATHGIVSSWYSVAIGIERAAYVVVRRGLTPTLARSSSIDTVERLRAHTIAHEDQLR